MTQRKAKLRKAIPAGIDVAVIGAGLGGLTCALELARQGLKVCLLEQHSVAGGYAHSFRRRGFHFDVSLHYIGGLDPGCMTHGVLESMGVLEKLQLRRRSALLTAEFPDFRVELPNSRQELIEELSRRWPAERSGIAELFEFLPRLKSDVLGALVDPDFDVPHEDRLAAGLEDTTFEQLARRYVSDPQLLAVLGQFWMYVGLPPNLATATFSTCVFCSSYVEGAYWIKGGGAALVRAMLERIRELGGECITNARVERIAVEEGAVSGVLLKDEVFIPARAVVSNANPYQTYLELLPEAISKVLRFRLDQMEPSLSLYTLYLGLNRLPSQVGITSKHLVVNHGTDLDAAYQRTLAHDIDHTDWCLTSYEGTGMVKHPEGGGIISTAELTPSRDWLTLDPEAYKVRKREVEERLLCKVLNRFPQVRDNIVFREFGTPRTMARYTLNHQGAIYGFAQTLEQSNRRRLGNRTPVDRLFLTGAWTLAGGGYEGAIISGLQTAQAALGGLEVTPTAPKVRLLGPGESLAQPDGDADGAAHDHDGVPALTRDVELGEEYYRFKLPIVVYGDDLNSRGFVDASSYLRYMDRARVEAIEALCQKQDKPSWLRSFIVNVYRIELTCATLSSLGNRLEVLTGLRKTSSHRAAIDQRIVRRDTREVVADGLVEVLFLDNERRLAPVPEELLGLEPKVPRAGASEMVPFSDEDFFPFRTPFRIYYEDTDIQGITYHVAYIRFCERTLFDLVWTIWPELPTKSTWLSRNKVNVSSINIRYLNSSTLGDRLEVRTGVLNASSHSILLGQRIVFADTGKVVADVRTGVEFRNEDDRIVPVPPEVRDASAAVLLAKRQGRKLV